ncbi:MAG TPA: CHAT domain-containing protein, partial [Aggregatilineales bacterium]|nr:CHAT domain-containing protein [Aggregatilineales bacterium]
MSDSSYLSFELHISRMEGGFYQAKVTKAPQPLPPESPSHEFVLPFDEATLRRIQMILSGERRSRGVTQNETATQFGEALFGAVFAGDVFEAYNTARVLTIAQEKGLRIRLDLSRAGELTKLPWEFLRDPAVDFLALSRSTPLIRNARQLVDVTRLKMSLPLRILVMISDPADVPHIDNESERGNLERATKRLRDSGLVQIDYLEDATLRSLQRKLRQDVYHVFHYIGHSYFDAQTEVGMLVLEDPYDLSKAYPIRGEALARELHEEETLRLVVLNSCQAAQAAQDNPFSGVASSLVQRGMPAVVAQQYEISDRAAIVFSEEFYRAVAEGFAIEAAVAEGRRAIASTLGNSEWATPVLFLHESDSQRIFDFPSEDENTFLARLWDNELSRAQIVAGFFAIWLILMVIMLSGFLLTRDDVRANFAPPTATAIPDVDLVIKDVRLSPRNPQPGDFVAVFVDIENQGTDPSPPFSYEWQASNFDPGSVVSKRVEGLAPGGVLHDNLTVRFGWWGVFISETRVDVSNDVIEKAEQNSRLTPVNIPKASPFVIDFNEPLPNGEFVRQNMPVPLNAFEAWGFQIDAEAVDNPACSDVIAWFKFVGVSRVALGTGLPTDPAQCTGETIVIVFNEQRADNNPGGV